MEQKRNGLIGDSQPDGLSSTKDSLGVKKKSPYKNIKSGLFLSSVLIFASFVAFPYQSAQATNPYIEFCWDQTLGFFDFLIDIAKGLKWLLGPWIVVLAVVIALGLGVIFSLTCPPNFVPPPTETNLSFLECNEEGRWVGTPTKLLQKSGVQDGNDFLILGKWETSVNYNFEQSDVSFSNRVVEFPDVQLVNGFIPFMIMLLTSIFEAALDALGLGPLASFIGSLIIGILFGIFDYKFFFGIEPAVRGDGHVTHPTTSIKDVTTTNPFTSFNIGVNPVDFKASARNFGTTDSDTVYINVVDTFPPEIIFEKKTVILEANTHFGWELTPESKAEFGTVTIDDACNPNTPITYLGNTFFPLTLISTDAGFPIQRTAWWASDRPYQIVPPSAEEIGRSLDLANPGELDAIGTFDLPCGPHEDFISADTLPFESDGKTVLQKVNDPNFMDARGQAFLQSDCIQFFGFGGGSPPSGLLKAGLRFLFMEVLLDEVNIKAFSAALDVRGLKTNTLVSDPDAFKGKTFKQTFKGIKADIEAQNKFATGEGRFIVNPSSKQLKADFEASSFTKKAKIAKGAFADALSGGKLGKVLFKKAFGAGFGAGFIAASQAIWPPGSPTYIDAPVLETFAEQEIFVQDTIPPDIFVPRHHAEEIDVDSNENCDTSSLPVMCEIEVLPPLVFDVADPFPEFVQNFTAGDGTFEPLDGDALTGEFPVGQTTSILWKATDFSENVSDEIELLVTLKETGTNKISVPFSQNVSNAFANTSTEITVQATNPDRDPLQFRIVSNPSDGIIESPLDAVFQNKFQKEGTISLLKGITTGAGTDTIYFTDSANKRVIKTDPAMMLETIFNTTDTSENPEAISFNPFGIFAIADWDNNNDDFILGVTDGGDFASIFRIFNVTGLFEDPKNIAIPKSPDSASLNDIYVTDFANGTVSRLSEFEMFTSPRAVATDDSKVYVTHLNPSGEYQVSKFDSEGMFEEKFGTTGQGNSEFDMPDGIAVNSTNIFVADTKNNRIQIFNQTGDFVLKIGASNGDGTAGKGNSEFDLPFGIAVNDTHIYVADTNNNRTQIFNENGDFVLKIGASGGDGTAGNGPGEFDQPKAIASNGTYIFVADTNNHRIQIFNSSAKHVTSLGVMGSGTLEFIQPSGITANSTHIVVSDTGNHRLQVIDPSDGSTEIIGSMGTEPGKFSNPTSVAFDESGNMYVVDQGNNRIQKLDSSGMFLNEIISSVDSRFDGFMTQFLLSIPNLHADAIANSGNHIFIGDWTSENKRIFKLPRDGGNIIEFNVENLVDDPKSIAINNTDSTIFITDNEDNEIVVLDSTGNFVKTIGISFAPEGISIDGDNIIVSNWVDEKIFTLDSTGNEIGNPFNVTTIFNDPKDIETNSTHIFVTENGADPKKIVKIRKDKGIINEFDVPGPPVDKRGFTIGIGLEREQIFFANSSENKIINVTTAPFERSELLDFTDTMITQADDIAINPMLAEPAISFAMDLDDELGFPTGLTFGPDGNSDGIDDLYVANFDDTIKRYDGITGDFIDDFVVDEERIITPRDIVFHDDDLFVSNFGVNNILRYDGEDGSFIEVFAEGATLSGPTGITFGPDGNLYVSNSGEKNVLSFYGENGTFIGEFIKQADSKLNLPQGLVFGPGPDEDLYVSSFNTNNIQKYDGSTGEFKEIANSGGDLVGPIGLAFRPNNESFFVSSSVNDLILEYSLGGGLIGNFSKEAITPNNLVFDTDGKLYVSSYGSDEILRFGDDPTKYYIGDWSQNRIFGIQKNGSLVEPLVVFDVSDAECDDCGLVNLEPQYFDTDSDGNIWISYSNGVDGVLKQIKRTNGDKIQTITLTDVPVDGAPELFSVMTGDGTEVMLDTTEGEFMMEEEVIDEISINPGGISLTFNDVIFVSDWDKNRIVVLFNNGIAANILKINSTFAEPKDLAVQLGDGDFENIFVSDATSEKIFILRSDRVLEEFTVNDTPSLNGLTKIQGTNSFLFTNPPDGKVFELNETAHINPITDIFVKPDGISVPNDDRFYVTDWKDERILKLDNLGDRIGEPFDLSPVMFLDKDRLRDIEVNETQNLVWVADSRRGEITQVDLDTGSIASLIFKVADKFVLGSGLAVDSEDNFILASTKNNTIIKFDERGRKLGDKEITPEFLVPTIPLFISAIDISTFDFELTDIWSSFNTSDNADFSYLASHIDAGDVDPQFGVLSKFNSDLDEIKRLTVEFAPNAIAADANSNVYVSSGGNTIEKFNKDLDEVSIATFVAPDRILGLETFPAMISDIAIDSKGNIFASDSANHRINKFDSNGTPTGWLGRCDTGVNCDVNDQHSRGFQCTNATCVVVESNGPAFSQFHTPIAISVDGSGNLFVADSQIKASGVNAPRIQKFSNEGIFIENTLSDVTQSKIKGNFISPNAIVSGSNNFFVLDEKKLHVFDTNPFSPFRIASPTNITSSDVSYRANIDFFPTDNFTFNVFDGFDKSEDVGFVNITINDPDMDDDGLFADVDQNLDDESFFFKDDSKTERTTSGTIDMGKQDVIILDSRDKTKGVTIQADIVPVGIAPFTPAVITACDESIQIMLEEGNKIELTCDPPTVEVIRGVVGVQFFDEDGRIGTILGGGLGIEHSLSFDPSDFKFTPGKGNFEDVTVKVLFNDVTKDYVIEPGKPVKIDTAKPDLESVCPESISIESEITAGVERSSALHGDEITPFLDFLVHDVDDGIPPLSSTVPILVDHNAPDIFLYNVTTIVDFSVTDEIGNIATCISSVTAKDSTPPEITYTFPIIGVEEEQVLEATTSIYNDGVPLYYGTGNTFDVLFATATDLRESVGDLPAEISSSSHPVGCYPPQGSAFPLGQSIVVCNIADNWPVVGSKAFRVEVFPNPNGVVIESITASDAAKPDGYSQGDTITVIFSQPTNGTGSLTMAEIDNIISFTPPIDGDYTGVFVNPSILIITIKTPAIVPPTTFPSPSAPTAAINSKTAITSASGVIESSLASSPPLAGSFDEIQAPFITAFIAHDPDLVESDEEDTDLRGNIEPSVGDLFTIRFSEPTNTPGGFAVQEESTVDTMFDFMGKTPGEEYSGKWVDSRTFQITILNNNGDDQDDLLIGQSKVKVKLDADIRNDEKTSSKSIATSKPLIGSFGPFNVMKKVEPGRTATTFLPSGIQAEITFPEGADAVVITSTEISKVGLIQFLGNSIDIDLDEEENPCSMGCTIKFTFTTDDMSRVGLAGKVLSIFHDKNDNGKVDFGEKLITTITNGPTLSTFTATATFFSTSTFGVGAQIKTGGTGGGSTSPTFSSAFFTGVKTQLDDGTFGFGGILSQEIEFSNSMPTAIVETGTPVKMKLVLEAKGGAQSIQHISLYTNLRGFSNEIWDSDAFVRYEKGKIIQVEDPQGFFKDADVTIIDRDKTVEVLFEMTFAKEMKTSDVLIRVWDTHKNSRDVKFIEAIQVIQSSKDKLPDETILEINMIPQDIIEKWTGYSNEVLSDSEFLQSIGIDGDSIPSWYKKMIANEVINEKISHQELIDALNFLSKTGLLIK